MGYRSALQGNSHPRRAGMDPLGHVLRDPLVLHDALWNLGSNNLVIWQEKYLVHASANIRESEG